MIVILSILSFMLAALALDRHLRLRSAEREIDDCKYGIMAIQDTNLRLTEEQASYRRELLVVQEQYQAFRDRVGAALGQSLEAEYGSNPVGTVPALGVRSGPAGDMDTVARRGAAKDV